MKAYLRNSQGLTIFLDGKAYNVQQDHPYFDEIVKGLEDDRVSTKTLVAKINLSEKINIEGCGTFKVVGETLVDKNGVVLDNSLTHQLSRLVREKKPIKFLVKFVENLYKNPSRVAVEELYDFLQTNELPITEDGCFLAYKSVKLDYTDHHTGTFDNSVGKVLEMPRNRVDDDRTRTCSYGFHVARYDYAKNFQSDEISRIVVCKVNPKDVVSVPPDYDCAKLRTCKYEVLAEDKDRADHLKGVSAVNTATVEELLSILGSLSSED